MNEPLSPPPAKPFRNPYADVPEGKHALIQVKVDGHKYRTLQSIRPGNNTISAVIGTIFQKLMLTLEERDIRDMSNENELEDFINNVVLITKNEYEQLRADSSNFERLLESDNRSGVERRPPLGRGLHDSSTGGPDSQANAPVHGAGTQGPRADSPPKQNVLPDIQSKGARTRARKSREDHQDKNSAEGAKS